MITREQNEPPWLRDRLQCALNACEPNRELFELAETAARFGEPVEVGPDLLCIHQAFTPAIASRRSTSMTRSSWPAISSNAASTRLVWWIPSDVAPIFANQAARCSAQLNRPCT